MRRVTISAGSFFDRVPTGGDIYQLKHVVHDWQDDQAAAVRELLGAINYLAAKVVMVESESAPAADTLFPEAVVAGPSMNKPCADCHQQFGDYCLLACPFGKRKADAD